MKAILLTLAVAAAAVLAPTEDALAAAPAEKASCSAKITDAIVRMPPGGRMMAGYFTISNGCDRKPLVLNAARSADFGEVTIHQTSIEAGVSRMRYMPSLTIAGGDRAVFKPGGLHLMLMKPKKTFKAGDTVRVRLSGPGWNQTVSFSVQSMTD